MSQYKTIEVAKNDTARFPLMRFIHKNNLVIRKLGIRHHTCHNLSAALVISRGENILIEDCDFSNNVAEGLRLAGLNNAVVRRTKANFNGKAGFAMGGSRFVLFEDCQTNFNNYRGGWGGYQHWDPSGFKNGNVHKVVYRRHTSIGNKANALWFDVFCTDILVDRCTFIGNTRMGLMFELTRAKGGPMVARDVLSAWNGGTGIFISMAANSAVIRSVMINNGDEHDRGDPYDFFASQLCFKFAPHREGPKSSADWQSVVLLDNVLASNNKMPLIRYGNRKVKPEQMYPWVLKVLMANGNIYQSNSPKHFHLPTGQWGKLREWQKLLKEVNAPGWQDKHASTGRLRFANTLSNALTLKHDQVLRQLCKERDIPLDDEALKTWRDMHEQGRFDKPYVYYKMQMFN